jgi:hypothetical protein
MSHTGFKYVKMATHLEARWHESIWQCTECWKAQLLIIWGCWFKGVNLSYGHFLRFVCLVSLTAATSRLSVPSLPVQQRPLLGTLRVHCTLVASKSDKTPHVPIQTTIWHFKKDSLSRDFKRPYKIPKLGQEVTMWRPGSNLDSPDYLLTDVRMSLSHFQYLAFLILVSFDA